MSGFEPNQRCPQGLRRELTVAVDGLCALCWKRKFLDAHRVIPNREGGEYILENVVLLCKTCHEIIERQTGVRRALRSLRWGLEWAVAQNRVLRQPLSPRELRERWDCRRVIHGKDHILPKIRNLFKDIREKEREHLPDINKWLNEMVTWRRLCRRAITLIRHISLSDSLMRIKGDLQHDLQDPRNVYLLSGLEKIESVSQLIEFYYNEIYRLEDYLIVHLNKNQPIGLIWFQYYFKYKYAFISYLILARPSVKKQGRPYLLNSFQLLVMRGLFRTLAMCHPECKGVIMEVDTEKQDRIQRGRGLKRLIKLRFEGFRLVDAHYVQPRSLTHGERDEMPLYLIWFPLFQHNTHDSATNIISYSLRKEEYSNMLDCIYKGVYLDELDNIEKFDGKVYSEYISYLSELKKRVLERAVDDIKLI